MNREHIQRLILEELARLAPEADLAALAPQAQIREELDLDSFDFTRFVTGLSRRLGVDVPEADYSRLDTLAGGLDYLERLVCPSPAIEEN